MKPTSLEPVFMNITTDISPLRKIARRNYSMSELRHAIGQMPFTAVYDFLRAHALDMIEKGRTDEAIDTIRDFDALVERAITDEGGSLLDTHAAMMQVLTALLIEAGRLDEAKVTAAATLSLLAQEPKRKDEPFLATLATLLYDVAYLHAERSEFKQAERELEKSMKLFERLAKVNPERYGPAHIMAMNATTTVYRNRVKQANMLAHYQVATSTYLQMVNRGVDEAMTKLIDSLVTEGRTLADMGRHREAITYFTRALKYLTRLSPDFDIAQLDLSIDLGESLLNVKSTRDKGVHLLNTMLHKATKINADEQHRRIVDILVNARSRRLDILDIWHKVFPR